MALSSAPAGDAGAHEIDIEGRTTGARQKR
jgi:hypothetical protein